MNKVLAQFDSNKKYSPHSIMDIGFLGSLGGKFSPLDISDMMCWHDASDITTITKDAGDLVSQWDDKSGLARHLKQTTGSDQPKWLSTDKNSLDVIDFGAVGATNARMLHDAWTEEAQPITVFIVMEAPILANFSIDGLATAKRNAIFCPGGNSNLRIYAGTVLEASTSVAGNWVYMFAVYDGGSSTFTAKDGTNTESASGNAGIEGITGYTLQTLFTQGSDFANDKVAEFIAYHKAVVDPERQRMLDYLSDKWGI